MLVAKLVMICCTKGDKFFETAFGEDAPQVLNGESGDSKSDCTVLAAVE